MGKLQIPARVARQDHELQAAGFLADEFQGPGQAVSVRVHQRVVEHQNLPLFF